MRDIFWGVVLIAIGLAFGGSVFLGEFSLLSIFFDGLGLFFIIRGLVRMNRAKRDAATQPTPPPPPPVALVRKNADMQKLDAEDAPR